MENIPDGIRHIKCDCGKEFDSLCYKESRELECPACSKMVPVPEYSGLFVSLRGKNTEVHLCHCEKCSAEFYMPACGEDWKPSFCPCCGLKFIGER